MGTRLTNDARRRLNARIRDYAFGERHKAIAAEKPALFKAALDAIHGADAMRRIARLPRHWFDPVSHLGLNLDGWNYGLSVPSDAALPAPARTAGEKPGQYRGNYAIADKALVDRLRDHATREETLRKEDRAMEGALAGLLAGCGTVETFLNVMPEARQAVGDAVAFAVPADARALTVSGRAVAAMVEKARAGSAAAAAKPAAKAKTPA